MSWLPSPEYADWWNYVSSRGLVVFAVITAIFLWLQVWASGELEKQANLALEKEHAERLKLEEKLAPRRLSPEQKKALVAALSLFAGQKVQLVPLGTTETKRFAEDFKSVFEDSGWVQVGGGVQYRFDVDPVGLQIVLSTADVDAGKIPTAANALPKALADCGLTAVGANANDVPPGNIEFRIGAKP